MTLNRVKGESLTTKTLFSMLKFKSIEELTHEGTVDIREVGPHVHKVIVFILHLDSESVVNFRLEPRFGCLLNVKVNPT